MFFPHKQQLMVHQSGSVYTSIYEYHITFISINPFLSKHELKITQVLAIRYPDGFSAYIKSQLLEA